MIDIDRIHSLDIVINKDYATDNYEAIKAYIEAWSNTEPIEIETESTEFETTIRITGELVKVLFISYKVLQIFGTNRQDIGAVNLDPAIISPLMDKDVIEMSGITIGIIPGSADIISNLKNYNKDIGSQYNPYTQIICQNLKPYITESSSVIDIGCGIGVPLFFSKKLGAKKVVGIDYTPYLCNSAREGARLNNLDIEILNQDYNEYVQNTSDKYDIVIFNQEAYTILSSLNKVLPLVKSGGKLFLSGFHSRLLNKVRDFISTIENLQIEFISEEYGNDTIKAILIICSVV